MHKKLDIFEYSITLDSFEDAYSSDSIKGNECLLIVGRDLATLHRVFP